MKNKITIASIFLVILIIIESLILVMFWHQQHPKKIIIFGIMGRKPQFLFYGIFFYFMHYVTAIILLTSFIPGFFSKSNGIWTSPKRHTLNG